MSCSPNDLLNANHLIFTNHSVCQLIFIITYNAYIIYCYKYYILSATYNIYHS